MQRRALSGVGLALGALLVGACGESAMHTDACTLIGCQDGLTIEVQASAWAPGTYVFDMTADGKSRRCEAKLPLPACDVQALTCTGDVEAQISVSGCALPAGSQGFGPITFRSGPANVEVAISRDGTSLGKGSFRPTYQTSRPNGPRCEPVCRQAEGRLVLGP